MSVNKRERAGVKPPIGHRRASASRAPDSAAPDIRRLVGEATRGDHWAWGELVKRYSDLLWAVTRAHRLNTVDAADVVQTSWLRLVEHLPEVRNPDGVGAWLATTARRECLRALRSAARCQPSDEIGPCAPAVDEVDAALLAAERNDRLRAAFGRLPERDQALLRVLSADPAPSYGEISTTLSMPIGSIGPTRARALARLRRELQRTERSPHLWAA